MPISEEDSPNDEAEEVAAAVLSTPELASTADEREALRRAIAEYKAAKGRVGRDAERVREETRARLVEEVLRGYGLSRWTLIACRSTRTSTRP